KLFFFGSYQGTRQLNGVAAQGTTSATLYPVPGNRESADFAARLGNAMCVGGFTTRGGSFERLTGERVIPAGGSIPVACGGSNINPVAIALLRLKLPNGNYYIPGSGVTPTGPSFNGTKQVLFSTPVTYREDQYIANGDWIVNADHSVQIRFMTAKNPYEYEL